MINPWFSPEVARWFACLSFFSLASILSHFIKQGRHRRVVTSIFRICACIGGVLLAAGTAAYLLHQPRHVVFALGFSGFVMTIVFAGALVKLPSQYAKAEMRRITASDM